jgi:hypothetical protein
MSSMNAKRRTNHRYKSSWESGARGGSGKGKGRSAWQRKSDKKRKAR